MFDSWLVCSARASLPLNVDLEMIFPTHNGVQSYKPKFELPSEVPAVQLLTVEQAAAGITAKLPSLHCMSKYEPLTPRCEWKLLRFKVAASMQSCNNAV